MFSQTVPRYLGLIGLVICVVGSEGSSAETVTSFGPETEVRVSDFQPHLMSNEMYFEQWTFTAWLSDGSLIGIDVAVTNLGVGDHKAGFKSRYEAPDGRTTSCKTDYDSDEWSFGREGLKMVFGENRIEGDLQKIKIHSHCDKLEFDIYFQNEMVPVRPGGGILKFGVDDGVYSMVFPVPRARVTGSMVLAGQQRDVLGVGYGEQSYTNMAPHKQARRWFRFKRVQPDLSIILAEMEATRDFGSASNGWLLMADDSGRIAATAKVRFTYDGFVRDDKSEEGFSIPRRVSVVALDDSVEVRGVLLMKGIRKIVDPTAELGTVQRAIARRLARPRDYYIDCNYQFLVRNGAAVKQVQGEGFYRFVYVNP